MPHSHSGGADRYRRDVTLLVGTHPSFLDHSAGEGHPERPARLAAVARGLESSGLGGEIRHFTPRPATRAELVAVHDPAYLDALEEAARRGGGRIDADTAFGAGSWEAALHAAGAGLDAVQRLADGEGTAAFLALRPPGHHARPATGMGFCLLNNVAVTAAALASAGQRVCIVDWDAHHGNGTQEIFYDDARILYVSLHQCPFYPGTGGRTEVGAGPGTWATLNIPLPPGSAGDAYRMALADLVLPRIAAFGPDWLLVSAGFDAHRDDPLCDLGLSAGDFGDLARAIGAAAPPGRCVAFLEGGYDLVALERSVAACAAGLVGATVVPEDPTSMGLGLDAVAAACRRWEGHVAAGPAQGGAGRSADGAGRSTDGATRGGAPGGHYPRRA